MGFGNYLRNIVNTATGGLTAPLIGGSSSYKENLVGLYSGQSNVVGRKNGLQTINNAINIKDQIAENLLKDADLRRRKLLYSTSFNETPIGEQVKYLLGN